MTPTTKKIIKYLGIPLLCLFTLSLIIPFGESYHRSVGHTLLYIFFSAILLIAFVILIVRNLYLAYKRKREIDLILPFLLVSFIFISKFASNAKEGKFWKELYCEASNINTGARRYGILMLYKDSTFVAKCQGVETSENYQGDFSIKSDTLYLNRDELFTITDSLFTNTYFINRGKSQLIPVQVKSDTLRIEYILD